jgi:DNA invertase Pin-like site-specific DNA recombinase
MALLIKGLHIEEIIIDADPEENQPELIEAEPLQEEPEKPEPKKTASKPAPKKTAPKKNTKPIDKGKIGALHRAGWSAAKIADEMKLGLSTVYKIIKEIQEESK